MKILIACEESQAVCKEMRRLGHEAYSCDIIGCSGGHPEWHIMGDVLPLIDGDCRFTTMDGEEHEIDGQWDMLIAHPPCTYISNAGACRLYPKKGILDEERLRKGIKAKDFFMRFYYAKCKRIAIENPIPSTVFCMPPYDQKIQPFHYGHPYKKTTCLWLKNLPKLTPTNIVEPTGYWVQPGGRTWAIAKNNGSYTTTGHRDAKTRSKTFPGIARAMAEQWAGQAEK